MAASEFHRLNGENRPDPAIQQESTNGWLTLNTRRTKTLAPPQRPLAILTEVSVHYLLGALYVRIVLVKQSRKAWWIGSGVIGAFLVGITWGIYVAYPIYTCYLVPAEVTNRVYSANLSYLERHQESELLELSADKIKQ